MKLSVLLLGLLLVVGALVCVSERACVACLASVGALHAKRQLQNSLCLFILTRPLSPCDMRRRRRCCAIAFGTGIA